MKKLDLHIGSKVHCSDGEWGSLARIVVNPDTQESTDIVVEKGIPLMKSNRVLPITLIQNATEAMIQLSIQSSELEKYPEYREVEVKEPDLTVQAGTATTPGGYADSSVPMIRRRLRQGIPSDMAIVGSGTSIETTDKTVGHVDHVLIDNSTGAITHLVMRKGLLFSDHLVIPRNMIESVGDHVYLNVSSKDLDTLPRYEEREAGEILADVQKRLAAESDTYGAVQATMENRTLRLAGLVRSRAIKYHAEQLAESVDGVIDVENNLLVDPDLEVQTSHETVDIELQIQTALASDPRTSNAVIEVIDDGGIIILQGVVDSAKTRKAVEEIAAQQSGVISVFNELVVLQR